MMIQNSTDFQNYVVWICENGTWRIPAWQYREGKWYSPYGIENQAHVAPDQEQVGQSLCSTRLGLSVTYGERLLSLGG